MKEILIHIGLHKTGTSAIQQFMFRNADLLRKNGIYYPTLKANHSTFLYPAFCDEKTKLEFGSVKRRKKIENLTKDCLQRLDKKLKNDKYEKIVISGEDLSLLSKEGVEKLHRWANKYSNKIKILIWVRNPYDWCSSYSQEMLKFGATLENLTSEIPIPEYKLKIKNYIDVFGAESVIIEKYENSIKEGLIESFLRKINLSPDIIEAADKPVKNETNTSLSMDAAFILSKLNEKNIKLTHETKNKIYRIAGNKFSLPHRILKKAIEKSKEDIKWLTENFGGSYEEYNSSFTKYKEGSSLKNESELNRMVEELIKSNERSKGSLRKAIFSIKNHYKKYILKNKI